MAAAPTFASRVGWPAGVAGAAFLLVGLFLSTFLGDAGALALGLGLGWVSYVGGRVALHVDRPRGLGASVQRALAGLAGGFAGFALLNALFVQGPGWPWTPWWALLAGLGVGLTRAHAPLLDQAREREDAPRWLGIVHPKDAQALVVLVAGYVTLGVFGYLLLRALLAFLPGQLFALALAAYALHGARLLLRFAAEERGAAGRGAVAWLKANALQLGIAALVLLAYALFRGELAGSVPSFALVEYGLGIAVFGFVLGRLRSRMKRDGTPLATASEARDHERVVTELREAEHDEVARPLTRFIESGQGAAEYAAALQRALPDEDARRAAIDETLGAHREPPRPPPLELPWSLAASGVVAVGLAVAALVAGLRVFRAEMPFPLLLGLMLLSFGIYALQDTARAHHRPRLSMAFAAGGTGLLLLTFLLFVGALGTLGNMPGLAWAIVAAVAGIMLGVPAVSAWRLEKRLHEGAVVDARRQSPAMEHAAALAKARSRAALLGLLALAALLPVPWLATWLGERGFVPAGFPTFLRDVLASLLWALAGLGGAALVRAYGLARGRTRLLAREQERRARRLHLHRTLMQHLERISP